jgi:excisionase family DNA binding protein
LAAHVHSPEPVLSLDSNAIAAVLGAITETPDRLAALEAKIVGLVDSVAAIRAALPPQLVTIKEAAKLYNVSTSTMRRWVRDRRVRSLEIESTVRVDVSKLAKQLTGKDPG